MQGTGFQGAVIAAMLCLAAEASAAPPEAVAAWAQLADVERVQSRFSSVQTRHILTRPQEATGHFVWASPNRLAWTWETPFTAVFVMNGASIGMAYPDLDVRETIDLEASPEYLRLVSGMTVWLGGDLAQVEKDYEVSWSDNAAVLVPRDEVLGRVFAELRIRFSDPPARPMGFTITEPDGDTLVVELEHYQANPPVDDTAFDLPP